MTRIGFGADAKRLESNAMIKKFNWRNVTVKFVECLRDERGIAMTEYLLISTFIALPAAFYLFNPDNGFYQAARNQYETTNIMLVLPFDHMPGS
jgi:hypothetical protein